MAINVIDVFLSQSSCKKNDAKPNQTSRCHQQKWYIHCQEYQHIVGAIEKIVLLEHILLDLYMSNYRTMLFRRHQVGALCFTLMPPLTEAAA